MPDRRAPVEPSGPGRVPRPQHPRGEHAVEQRLHQRRTEKPRPTLALKADAEGLFQCRPHRRQCRRIARRLDPRQRIAGMRRQQPSQILRLGQPRPMRQCPAQIFP